jgi:hypothetical protein
MTTSVRYKFTKNVTGAPLTIDNFPNQTDGDDKPKKFLRRSLTADDIGTNPGQIGHVDGLILEVLPPSYNVLWFEVNPFRPANVGGINQYNNIQNQVVTVNINLSTDSVELVFWVASDNTLRVFDKSHLNTAALLSGDVLTATVISGTRQNSLDFL